MHGDSLAVMPYDCIISILTYNNVFVILKSTISISVRRYVVAISISSMITAYKNA